MESEQALVIVSIFGRGNWLAAAAAEAGISTTLIDISEQMGFWGPEDWEGPFGQFLPDAFSKSQRERLQNDDQFVDSENGFTMWFESGPLELKSKTSSHRLETLGQSAQALAYLQDNVGFKYDISKFKESFLAYFSHYYSSSRFFSPVDGMGFGYPSPVFSKFGIKSPTRKGLEAGFAWLKSKGVTVIEKAKVKDVGLETATALGGIEVSTDRTWVIKAKQYVWMLSSEESGFIAGKIANDLYSGGIAEPIWSWVRYRYKVEPSLSVNQLPLHFVMIGDIEIPLTHDNYIIVNRTPSSEQFDFWIMIPTVQRFNKSYIAERGEDLREVFVNRLSGAEISLVSYPQEHSYTYNQLGPSRFPVFNLSVKATQSKKTIKNLILSSPEQWEHLSQEGQFKNHEIVLGEIKLWWTKLEEQRIKNELKLQGRNK